MHALLAQEMPLIPVATTSLHLVLSVSLSTLTLVSSPPQIQFLLHLSRSSQISVRFMTSFHGQIQVSSHQVHARFMAGACQIHATQLGPVTVGE